MFRRKNHFMFSGHMRKEKKSNLDKTDNYAAQIIVCGKLAKDVMVAFDKDKKFNIDDKNMYAMRFRKRSNFHFKSDVTIDSDVSYDERKKKKKEAAGLVVFKHQDEIKKLPSSGILSSSDYVLSEPDFASKDDLIIFIAADDNEEANRLGKELESKIGKRENVWCQVVQWPDEGEKTNPHALHAGWSFDRMRFDLGHRTLVFRDKLYSVFEPEDSVHSIKSAVDEAADAHDKKVVDELENEITSGLVKEMSDELHQKAEAHFARPWLRR